MPSGLSIHEAVLILLLAERFPHMQKNRQEQVERSQETEFDGGHHQAQWNEEQDLTVSPMGLSL